MLTEKDKLYLNKLLNAERNRVEKGTDMFEIDFIKQRLNKK